MGEEEKSQFTAAFVVGLVLVGLLVGGAYWLSRTVPGGSSATPAAPPLPSLGTAEEAYAQHIRVTDIHMSRATNMLHQEFTYINGILANDGTRSIRDIVLTIEFRDAFGQVVLRDVQRPFGTALKAGEPLPAGQRRDFQVTFEHVPEMWNQQYPNFRVTGLVLD